ncbi:hypothetical protein B0H19DRAFT_1059671 [Mycena capillaripes]|nr:hypothetical protein B0H19DRAFT_1059671 [Mycena capillaripes]
MRTDVQLISSILLGSLSLIPNNILRYTALGSVIVFTLIYNFHLRPATRLRELEQGIQQTEEFFERAKSNPCPQDKFKLTQEWLRLLEADGRRLGFWDDSITSSCQPQRVPIGPRHPKLLSGGRKSRFLKIQRHRLRAALPANLEVSLIWADGPSERSLYRIKQSASRTQCRVLKAGKLSWKQSWHFNKCVAECKNTVNNICTAVQLVLEAELQRKLAEDIVDTQSSLANAAAACAGTVFSLSMPGSAHKSAQYSRPMRESPISGSVIQWAVQNRFKTKRRVWALSACNTVTVNCVRQQTPRKK